MAKYATELREAVLRRVLSGDMTLTEASRHFDVSYWSVRSWVQKARRAAGAQASATEETTTMAKRKNDVPPLPDGRSCQEMMLILGHCRFLGMESSETGAFCRSQGLHLKDIQAFGRWYDAQGGVVSAKEQTRIRQELADKDKGMQELQNELKRKDKALAEAAALIVLSKKVRAIWEKEE